MQRNKKLYIRLCLIVGLITGSLWFGLPVLATSHFAIMIPGQPLSTIAAWEIINHSGLPIEKLPDGTTNNLTRARDAVNAYRLAHTELSAKGWYRGIGNDHTPLLDAMIKTMEIEGFTSKAADLPTKTAEVYTKFQTANILQSIVDGTKIWQ